MTVLEPCYAVFLIELLLRVEDDGCIFQQRERGVAKSTAPIPASWTSPCSRLRVVDITELAIVLTLLSSPTLQILVPEYSNKPRFSRKSS